MSLLEGFVVSGVTMPPKRSTTQRGYDYAHKQERARWQRQVDRGEADCARCGEWIEPGTPWDLGHTDDRTGWTGPEHASCNRADGARKRNGSQCERYTPSRDW